MAKILGDGAIRIWVGKNQETGKPGNLGVRISEDHLPEGTTAQDILDWLQPEVEKMLREKYPWCKE
jgi:hypothetical protein